MDLIYLSYLFAVGLTVVTTLYLAFFAWRRREIRGTVPFALAMLAISESATMYALLAVTPDSTLAFVWARLRFVGLAAIPVLIFTFILDYTNRTAWRSRRIRWTLWIVPLVTQIVLWFVPNSLFFQHWNLVHVGGANMEDSQFSGWFWIHMSYGYLLLIAGLAWLIYYVRRVDGSLTSAVRWMVGGIAIGILGALPGISIGAAPGFKFAPIGFGITGLGLAIALFRHRLFDTRPIAYDAIFRGIRDAVVIIDEHNAIIQINPEAERLLHQTQGDVIGKDVRILLKIDPDLLEKSIDVREAQLSASFVRREQTFFLDVHISPLYQGTRFVGRIIMLYDITARKQSDEALARAMADLTSTNVELRQEILKREQAETRFQNLLEITPDGILLVNEAGCITLVNAEAERLFDWERQYLIGQPVEMLLAESLRPAHIQHRITYNAEPYSRLMGGGMDLIARRKDGSTFRSEISLSPLQATEGALVMCVVHDITAHHEMTANLKQRNQTLQLLHETVSDIGAELKMDDLLRRIVNRAVSLLEADRGGGVYLYEPDRNLLRLAAGAGVNTDRVGITINLSEGLAGQVFRQAQPLIVNDYTRWDQRATVLVDDPSSAVMGVPLKVQETVVGTLLLIANSKRKTFNARDIELAEMFATYASVAIQNARFYNQAQQEITERKQAEQEREQLIIELNSFAHTIAHELKTPLSVILGYYLMLNESGIDYSDLPVQNMIKAIGRSGWKMTNIIDELLIFASVRELHQVKTVPLHMIDVISEALSRLEFLIQARQAIVVMPDAGNWPVAIGYIPWIEEVWTNYISNAIKYGGTPPHIELGATSNADGMVQFWVRDNGAGIAPDQQTTLFQKYNRLEEMRIDGHGLGLSIVKKIVEKLGGTVAVESAPGGGSIFSFTLPISEVISISDKA